MASNVSIPLEGQWQPVTQLTTPQQIKVSMNDIEEAPSKDRRKLQILLSSLLALLGVGAIGASIAVPMVINQRQIAMETSISTVIAVDEATTIGTTTNGSTMITSTYAMTTVSTSTVASTESALPTYWFSGATALPFWDDLFIYSSTSQGLYYGPEGNSPNRTMVFEFYMSHYSQTAEYYHYQVLFFDALLGIVQYKYFDVSNDGISCTVGVQDSSNGPFIQYSFDQANSVWSNLTLIFDINLGTFTNSTFG